MTKRKARTNAAARKSTAKLRGTAGAKRPALSTPVRDWPVLEVFVEGQFARAKKTVASQFGRTFAAKASDRLVQALSTVSMFALEATTPQARSTILEFSPPKASAKALAGRTLTLAGAGESVPAAVRRLSARYVMRDEFGKRIAAIRAELERRSHSMFAAGPEAVASPTTPSSVVEICWLNGTVRSYLDPRQLREVVEDPAVTLVDLPRRLLADIDATASRVGGPQFRQRFNVTGENITVAVIDGEVDIGHAALAGRVLQKANFTRERFGFPHPHGTAVAGIIGSADRTFTGIAPGVTIANYKVLATDASLNADDFGGSLAIQQALEDGAEIANCSWGAGAAGDGTSRECVACNTAWGLGLVIVKSAGNQGPGAATLTTPADADGIIVVGATDRAGTAVQDYSSRGPAGSKRRPHLVAPGGSEFDQMHSCIANDRFGDVGMGTSYAAPHVSGLAALLLAQTPGLDPNQIRTELIGHCTKLPAGGVNVQGAGLVSLEP